MSDESIQEAAENLRADFLNATTTHQRWKVLNRAIDYGIGQDTDCDGLKSIRDAYHEWFIDAPTAYKQWKLFLACVEWAMGRAAKRENADHYRQKSQTGWVRHGERTISDGERTVRAGDVVQHPDYDDDPWVVLSVEEGTLVKIAPLRYDYALNTCSVSAEHLFK